MNICLYIIVFIISAIVLTKSATYLVKSLTTIGRFFRVGEFAISFIMMAFATSLPELFVAVISTINYSSELALGTVIGSSIAALTLVIGIATVYAGKIRVRSIIKKKDIVYMVGICCILVLLMLDGSLTIPDSLILILIYMYYIYRLLTQQKQFESENVHVEKRDVLRSFAIVILCFVGLLLSARGLVWTVEHIGIYFHIPVTLIGLVVVAVGTSIPELSFELSAIKNKHQDMVLGDIIGSVVTNCALVIGVIGLIGPINHLDLGLINTSLFFIIMVSIIMLIFVKNDGKLTTREGVAMILGYLAFVATEYLVKIVKV